MKNTFMAAPAGQAAMEVSPLEKIKADASDVEFSIKNKTDFMFSFEKFEFGFKYLSAEKFNFYVKKNGRMKADKNLPVSKIGNEAHMGILKGYVDLYINGREKQKKAKKLLIDKYLNFSDWVDEQSLESIEKINSDEVFQTVINLLQENAHYFIDQFKQPHAAITFPNGVQKILPLRGSDFRRWAIWTVYNKYNFAPSRNVLENVISIFDAEAAHKSDINYLHNRVVWFDGCIWYDLSNEKWQAVRISENGWEVVDTPPILFKRYSHQKAQVIPSSDTTKNNFTLLHEFTALKDNDARQFLGGHIISLFVPDIPHAIPIFHGAQGSTKSTHGRLIKKLVDPSVVELLVMPKNRTELVQQTSHHYVIIYDNISKLEDWQSDILCCVATGQGFSKRMLYSDDDDINYSFIHCPGLNGINIAAEKSDILDRAGLYECERITKDKRKKEATFWANFESKKPFIIGAIFDTLVKAMEIKKILKIENLPRLADFAEWGEAISRALGNADGSWLKIYFENIRQQNEESIETAVIGNIFIKFYEDLPKDEKEKRTWEGSPSQLWKSLNTVAELEGIDTKNLKGFPKTPAVMGKQLRELRANFSEQGIDIVFSHSGRRLIFVNKSEEQLQPAVLPSKAPENSGNKPNGQQTTPKNMPSKPSNLKNEEDNLDGMDDSKIMPSNSDSPESANNKGNGRQDGMDGILIKKEEKTYKQEQEDKVFAVIEFLTRDSVASTPKIIQTCAADYEYSVETTQTAIAELLKERRIIDAHSYLDADGNEIHDYGVF